MSTFSGDLTPQEKSGLIRETSVDGGLFTCGIAGVENIYTTECGKLKFIEHTDKTLVFVPSSLGCPAIYPFRSVQYQGSPKAVLMDLDGTSVHSEEFWMYIIERTIANLMTRPSFHLETEDIPFVSGHSVSEHLQYCIDKYCPDFKVEEARDIYHRITEFEMNEIVQGRGKNDAFTPAPYLKEFLLGLKDNGVKIGLVTSGLYVKAMPEIISAFRVLGMGNPVEFYDAIITAGQAIRKGQPGTLGELAPKPHPWLYAETARVGLGLCENDAPHIIGLEDSSAGIYSLLLAGYPRIGVSGGNIKQSGAESLCSFTTNGLEESLKIILG